MAKKPQSPASDFSRNEWLGWMIFKRSGTMIGIVQSSFGLSKDTVEATCLARGRAGEEVRRVRLVLED